MSTKSGWYPGKFVKQMHQKATGEDPPMDDPDISQQDESHDDLMSKEHSMAKLIRAARNKYIERGLVGTITISRLSGVVTTEAECEVSADDLHDEESEEYSMYDKKAIDLMEVVIKNLEQRSVAWQSTEFKDSMTITRGASMGFYLPFFITVGFSIDIQLSATIASLLASRKKREEDATLKRCLQNIDPALVESLIAQGITKSLAQKAVIETNGTTVEAALKWAIEHAKT